jgi:acyl-CoA synthetase (AMP-forming)/AMP-acid ligase II
MKTLVAKKQLSTAQRLGASEIPRPRPIDLLASRGGGPDLIEPGAVSSAEALRHGARLWERAFRGAGLKAGDRVVVSLRPGFAFLAALVASLRSRLTLVLVPAGTEHAADLERFDARLVVGQVDGPMVWIPGPTGGPPEARPRNRSANGPRTPDARLVLATSGTTGVPRWLALSENNLRSVLRSHSPLLGLRGARALSALPWTHAFGLIIDLFPSLMAGATVILDAERGRDPRMTATLIRRHRISHLSAVPLLYRRLIEHCGDDELVRDLRGGVVGGAAITPSIAALLAPTRLRVGYGLTEASPGLALGRPGDWIAYGLGRAVCGEVRLSREGTLQFRGPNACLGVWSEGRLDQLESNRWVETGDLAEIRDGEIYYRGRADDRFKLANGRWIVASDCERRILRGFPSIDEALVFTPDGEHLAIAWTCSAAATRPDSARLREAMGPPGNFVRWELSIPRATWQRSPKGDIDRRATEWQLRAIVEGTPS